MSERLYKLPEVLKGRCDEDKYRAWLDLMTKSHRRRFSGTPGVTMAIHQAVEAHDGNDPYTGRPLRWDLIGTYDNDESQKNSRECRTKSADKPTVDHNFGSNGSLVGFEIVSQRVNDCKSDLSPEEFVSLCRTVFSHLHHDEKYSMDRTLELDPFPHTQVKTRRPDADPYDLSDDLLNWLAWEYVDPEEWSWVFRGVRNQCYFLKSTLYRKLDDRTRFGSADDKPEVDRQTAESYLLSHFKKAAHHFVEGSMIPDDNNTLEWLALMQHYGAPTRLLDFTRSSYVACFFALEKVTTREKPAKEATKKEKNGEIKNCAIWAVDTRWLIEMSFHRIVRRFPGLTEDSLLDSKFMAENFDKLFVKYKKPLILPIVPSRSNPRLLVQQGLFLCSSMIEGGFAKNLESYKHDAPDMDKHVCKIVIPGRIRTEVLSELRLMNISQANLFPGLEGYASSLAHELEYRSLDEIRWLR